MARRSRPTVDERLARHRAAQEVHRVLGSGIDLLPTTELTKTILRVKSGELVASAAETASALAEAAGVAAQDGRQAFQRARAEARTSDGGSAGGPATGGDATAGGSPAADWVVDESGTGSPASGGAGGDAARTADDDAASPGPGRAWLRKSTGTPPSATAPAGAAPTDEGVDEDLIARLERLSALHAAGHLDDREYAAAKSRVLGLD